ncbi:MAG TPA: ATP-binding protein [Solirubrobacteraceae bacterium]|jgi:anti-sigma regulatory factor (Ser/Thr protein kinase)|nr:ATP-binding protein [Solirubrobacteraceae bacterium]
MTVHSSEKISSGKRCSTLRLELVLERNVQAPALARTEIAKRCRELELGGSLCQSLILLVSEVMSNAVRHSAGDPQAPIELVASFGEQSIRVTVTDPGRGFTPRPRDPARTHDGYGLYLLEKVATRWGVESRGDTKVWFELPRRG